MPLLQNLPRRGWCPSSHSKFSASEIGLGPVQGTAGLARCGGGPNLVTNLLCDSVWVSYSGRFSLPFQWPRDKFQRVYCSRVCWILPGLGGTLSRFQTLGSPGQEPTSSPSTLLLKHTSLSPACLALGPALSDSLYHLDSTHSNFTVGPLVIL